MYILCHVHRFSDVITNISIRITFYLCYYDIFIHILHHLTPFNPTLLIESRGLNEEVEKNQFHQKCAWLQAFHFIYLRCCCCVHTSLIVFAFNIIGIYLFLISLVTVDGFQLVHNVVFLFVDNARVMTKKPKKCISTATLEAERSEWGRKIILFMYIQW